MVFPKDEPSDVTLYGTLIRLRKLRRTEPKAALYIEKWCENRQKTINLIPKLRETVETICSRCRAGRQVGAAFSVSGVLTAVIGAILKWKGFPVGDQFLDGGKYLTGTGTAVLATSNLAEACLTLSPTNRIKEVIQEDIERTEEIRKWIELSREVEYCFEKLLQCNVASPGLLKVMKVLDDCISLLNAGSYEIDTLIQDLQCCKVRGIENVTNDVRIKVIRFLERIRNNPNIRKPLKEICEIACENPSLIRFISAGSNLHLQAYGILPSLPFDLKLSNVLSYAFDAIKMLHNLVTNFKFEEIEKRQTAYFEALDRVTKALKSELKEVEYSLNEPLSDHCETLFEKLNDLRLGYQ